MAKTGGLGLGLDALFSDNTTDTQVKRTLRVSQIEPNRSQPRKSFSEETIAALAESISQHGMIQPILVRPLEGGSYQIVAGERRWRAARMLAMDEVPVIIKDLSDIEAMQISLIENLQRENLNPIEEAMGYKELIDIYNMTQDAVAKTVGRSRSAIANSLRLLNLPKEVQQMLKDGDITVGHAKALVSVDDEDLLMELAVKAASDKLTVRAIEKIISKLDEPKIEVENTDKIDSYFKEVEISLNERLGRRVKVDYSKNKGALILEFYNKEDLAEIAKKLVED
ncbi:MAG: ParB/RepB/Spo0J family partition protein [Clostridiales bacterium]|jgi:ParB family chromosome partitioning protein|nr:ParB/RepB/Spo0J family partition protein [Clostridiales bacterium]